MYEIDATRGYVLGYYNVGEADRRYRILTDTEGLIHARATSVRKESSKLKHFLQKFNLAEIETVDSRRGIQITGGRLIQSLARECSHEVLGTAERVGILIARLSHNPDPDADLFTIYQQVIQAACTDPERLPEIELWAQSRVLHAFGYFDTGFLPDINPEIFTKGDLDASELDQLEEHAKALARYIEQCINQTML